MPRPTLLRRPVAGRVPNRRHALAAAVAGVVLAVGLSGCTPGPAPTGGPTGDGSATGGTSSAPKTPAPAPTFVPKGTAEQNLPIFAATVAKVWASEKSRGHGRAYVDALTKIGFDKKAMQLTNDESTVGNPAESIEFSVLVGKECLVGQVGTAIKRPVAKVLPVVGGGTCLIGKTRPINW